MHPASRRPFADEMARCPLPIAGGSRLEDERHVPDEAG
jgi:hypothetical protein